jgi:CSLREA domain-containing protein
MTQVARRAAGALVLTIALALLLGALRPAPSAPSAPSAPAAFPGDNGRLLYHEGDEGGADRLLARDANGENELSLTGALDGDLSGAWSPDGDTVVFSSTRSGERCIWVMDDDGSDAQQLTFTPCDDVEPAWSPEGTRIAFASRRDGQATYELYVMDADGSDLTELSTGAGDARNPAWSPSGALVAYDSDATGERQIHLFNVGSGAVTQLTAGAAHFNPDWAPDGEQVAFVRQVAGEHDVHRMDPDPEATPVAVVAVEGINETDPAWSPDGTRIAYARDNGTGITGIRHVDSTTGLDSVTVTATEVAVHDRPDWQPLPIPDYVVNTAQHADNGPCDVAHCTLREAIDEANVNPGHDLIVFDIPGEGPHTITVTEVPLPALSDPVTIDGYTQPGSEENANETAFSGTLQIELAPSPSVFGEDPVSGLLVLTSDSVIRGLVVRGFDRGIWIGGTGNDRNTIAGNLIGVDATGEAADGNSIAGVRVSGAVAGNVVGGADPADRNVISGNATESSATGVLLDAGSTETKVANNLIGTDADGDTALPNSFGMRVSDSSGNLIHDNVVSGNLDDGINLSADVPAQTRFNEIDANLVGTDAEGAVALGNGGDGINLNVVGENVIGGNGGDGNIVADSFGHGIFLFDSTDVLVEGNFVGTDAGGTADLGNGIDGIAVDGGGNHDIRSNLASGNTNQGIAIFRVSSLVMPSGVTVEGNKAGTDSSGTAPLPNGGHGILLGRAEFTTVGGGTDSLPNRVAFNGGSGIAVAAEGLGNSVQGNSVEQNGGLGIDIVPDGGPTGVTPNDEFDTDLGPNDFQNFPVVTAVAEDGEETVAVTARLDTPSGSDLGYTIDYYASPDCDPSGNGEGARYLGFDNVILARGAESAPPSFTSEGIDGPLAGEVLTATATDGLGNTSELSACFDPAAETTVTLALTADPSVQAGAARVKYADVPLSVFARGSAPTGGTTGSAPLDAIPLDAIPLDAIPLDAIPLDAIPLDAIPLDAIGLGSAVLDNTLGGLPLTFVPLNPVRVPGGWDALLATTSLAHRPAVTVTLADVFGLQPLPLKQDGEPLSVADLDLAASPLGDLPLAALVLGPIRLAEIPLDARSTGEADNLAAWCEAIDEQPGSDCSNAATLGQATVMSTALGGVPLDAIPLDAIPLDAIPLDAIPLDAIPLDAILMKGSPLDAIPLDAIPLDAIPLDAIPLDAIGLGALPLDAILASRATPLDAIPLDAIPLDAIPLDAIGLVVSCDATFVCSGQTLGDAWRAGRVLPTAQLRHLDGALGTLTLGDLGHYGDVTLGQLREYGDTTVGDILEHVPGLTLGDLLLALLAPEAYPWEKLSYARLDPARYATDGSRVTYRGAFEIADGAPTTNVTVRAALPPGFFYLPHSTQLEFTTVISETEIISGVLIPEEPQIEGRMLTFNLPGIASNSDYALVLQARPSIVLGIGAASATATPTVGPETAPDGAETAITETFPSNDEPDAAPILVDDSYYLSHVTGAGDVDYYRFPVPPAGTRVTFHLSHLAADYDLAVYGPGRIAPPRDTTNEGIPLDGLPLADEPADLQPLAESLTPEALDDVPLLDDRPLWGLSINRETEDEDVVVVSNGEQAFEGTLYYTVQVSGYNGASSPAPYMLRAQVRAPRTFPECQPRTLSLGAPGTSVNHLSTNLNTVFLVNMQRLRATYGADAEVALNALQSNLTALEGLGAKSAIIALDAFDPVRTAYTAWDANPCSPHLANRVVRAATDVLDGIRAANPTLKHVVLVGGDDLVPHARIDDATTYANESQHAGTFRQADQYLGSFANAKLLTDNPYGTVRPIRFFNRHLYLPELRVGRLVETPADIARALDAFVDFDGVLAPQTAFTTGYEFLSDGAQEIHGQLDQLVGPATSRIDETWTSDDVRNALRATPPPAITSINAHYDHHRSLPANENAAGTEAALFRTSDIRSPLTPNLDRRLLFTMGCHAGLSLSDVVVGSTVPSLDWAQAVAEKGGSFAANTGFGLGDTEVVGYTERLLALFAEELRHAETIASALDRAKRRYLALQGVVGVYDEKVVSQMTLYGLPMWRIRAGQQPPAPPPPPPTETDPVTGLAASSFDVAPTFALRPVGAAPRGNYYAVTGGDVQATHFRPLQPRLHLPVQPNAHGALVTALASVDQGNATSGWFDPVHSRPTVDRAANEPELSYGETAFPTKIQSITRGPDASSLVLLVGQFFTSEGAPAGLGTQRRFTNVEGLVYGSASTEWTPPRLDRIDAVKIGPQVAFSVDVTDPGVGTANVRRVYVLFRDQANEWHGLDLVRGPGSVWTGGAPLVGDQVEYFVQAVDAAGNVAVSTRKGRYFEARPAVALPDGLEVDLVPVAPGVETPSGWFTGAVDVQLTGPEPLEVSVDGGDFERYGTLRVSGNGVHTVDIRGPEGLAATVFVPIDGASPTVTITRPAPGEEVERDSTVRPEFTCGDAGSGIVSCTASSDPLSTSTVGPKTLTVTATDAAGNTASAQVSYTVVLTFESFMLAIDKDSIDNGRPPNNFSKAAVNDGSARIGLRTTLPAFAGANVGRRLTLHTGAVGSEGWFALKTVPASWVSTGPTTDGLRNYLLAGPGLGSGSNRERFLDKVPNVTPLRATGLKRLVGEWVCAVVYDDDVSINYAPLTGSLKGDNLGVVAFKVLSVTRLTGFGSSALPKVEVEVGDRNAACGAVLVMHSAAPAPVSSSVPFDVNP